MKNNLSNIKKAIKYLNNGQCIAVPTETVYGLAANAYSNKATEKIFKLKKRPKSNPLIVHYYNLKDLKKDCEINDLFLKIYKKFSPGPISYILKLKKKNKISKNVTNGKQTVAVRFPKHKLTRKLLKDLKYPLAAPSANMSKKISPVSKEDVIDEFGNKIKFILDGGRCKFGLESTIISLENNPEVLRLGAIDKKKLKKYLVKKNNQKTRKKKILVPGQGKVHYSPDIPIRLNATQPKKGEAFLLIKNRKEKNKNYYYLSKNKNMEEVGKNLYKKLRKIKNKGFKFIAVEKIPKKGIGEVINDRLLRASKKL